MAWFNTKPYLMVNTSYGPAYFKRTDMVVTVEPGIQRFCFARASQRIVNSKETKEILIEEFARMWANADLSAWQTSQGAESKTASDLSTWLR
jgi:hypothetical protein